MLRNRAYFFVAIAALFAAPVLAEVKPGNTRYFKNWAAGCDNGLSCEAVAMLPPELPEGMLSLVLSRTAAKDDALKINIFGFDSESDAYQLSIDGKLVNAGKVIQGIAPISVTGKDALKLVRAMIKGNEAIVTDGAGKTLGKISLSGSSAALRHLDSAQHRAGTASALAARGKRKYRKLPPPLPVISAPRLIPGNDIPDTSTLVALAEGSSCAEDRIGVTQDAVYGLDAKDGRPRALALISCGNGAYNLVSTAFIGIKDAAGKWKFAPAGYDYFGTNFGDKADLKLIVNAGWDAEKQTLSTFSKSRGIGDCGRSADYVWDGNMFRLTHARTMEECQGSVDWITVWRANVAFSG
jgi:hypothetical protein